MREWEAKYVEKYPIVGVLLGRGTIGGVDFVPAEGAPVEELVRADQFHCAAGPEGAAEAASRALEEAAKEHDCCWPIPPPDLSSPGEQAGAGSVAADAAEDSGAGSSTGMGLSTAKRRKA
jgi:hypothetical protein